jgi:hypothetical protein
MIVPRSRSWTPRQKLMIATASALLVIAFGALVYGYERYYRGPSEDALLGRWAAYIQNDTTFYYDFRRDHTFRVLSTDQTSVVVAGHWYAGGKQVYLRFPHDQPFAGRDLIIWQIIDISPEAIQFRLLRDGPVHIYPRVASG